METVRNSCLDNKSTSQGKSIMQLPPAVQQQPAQHAGGLSRRMLISLIVLALLSMVSGIGLIYYSTVYHPTQLHAQSTATTQALQTREAQGLATAKAQATAEVQATATVLQNIYTLATSGSPTLSDSLAGNSGSGWDEDQAQGGGGCGFTSGAYHASLYSKGFYFPCFAQNTNFSNLAYQVQMTITRGDYGGLIFRANSKATKFYVFRLESDGIYDLFVSQDNNHTTELSYGNSPAIHKYAGHSNLLTVVARGSNMYLYINKQYVSTVSDDSYKSGQIGVFAEDHTHPTDVAFSNVQVWKL